MAYIHLLKAPRTGEPVYDDALDEAELQELNHNATQLVCNYNDVLYEGIPSWVGPMIRPVTTERGVVFVATVSLPDIPFIIACGVGTRRDEAKSRASMHVLALLKRMDGDFDERYEFSKQQLE